jgi:hypothetical protein
MRVAVIARSELEARAAAALAGHPSVETVGIIGRHAPAAWRGRIVEVGDASGFPIVVGADAQEAAGPGSVAVVPGAAHAGGWAVTHAGLTGLTRALAVHLGGRGEEGAGELLAHTVPGRPVRPRPGPSDLNVVFPTPLGVLGIESVSEGIGLAPVEGMWAGASAQVGDRRLVVVDDRRFLLAACLAAGAFVATGVGEGIVPVWERAAAFLAALADLGVPTAAPVG